MATRAYPRNGLAFSEPQLSALLDAALGLTGCTTNATEAFIAVTHPSLTGAHDAGVATVLAAYVLDPDFGQATERLKLRGKVQVLRQWEADGEAVFGAGGTWDGMTTAQRFAVMKIMGDRVTKFFGSMADVLQVQGLN